ncbi:MULTISPECIES: FtsW/RodA/SpoVE family cell cycle protein [Brachybacterium]|uniref:FtsW/RodA/SpoVE family cell cycle protein n=2 Tax=Brachybacterium TaxID=43668 RepID=A0A3R8QMY3_9MICO|nr:MULTISPECIES: FtsW/RodA/SpoVE family cell cycle protein [Brachybacterium]MCT1438611.1 FtsW/RodA/SpoVE family cell cycle protein [Brachybacterium paraconglomeratum]RRR18521.1 FtsW/RodA/SpoVE family cell cycle protein [Brachybacterium paraconglomeratum]GLI30171.1 cell division protein [Brachybacterium conglomeratum]GLK04709.1 cell division protein [Brachybacterium conglomeratum]
MATIVSYTARPRRLIQALLLLLAVAVGVGAYALVGLGRFDELPAKLLQVGIGALVLVAVLQIAVMWRAPYADPVILPIVVLLNLLGVTMIESVHAANEIYGLRSSASADRQMLWAVIGVVLCVALLVLLRDHRWLRRYTWISAVAGGVLLLLPLVPVIGSARNGSKIWISVAGFSFQPAELAKIAFAVFFAGYLVARRDTLALAGPKVLGIHLPRWSDFGPILVAWGFAMAVLVFETDLGTSLMFFGLFVVMLYVATDRLSWLVIGAVMFLPPAVFAATQMSHVRTRITCWLDPLSGENYSSCEQISQGLFGLANGGLVGTGLGEGRPDMVPHAESDFIFSSFAEEMGMVGAFALLLLYLLLVQRAIRAAVGISDGFGTLLAGGLGFVMALQVFVVVGGVTRVIPLTGLTLPFLAAGGSSLVCNWIIAGILVRLSDAARRPAARQVEGTLPGSPARSGQEAIA